MTIKICLSRHANSARHTKDGAGSQVSEQHPNLTLNGVEQAKKTAREQILSTIEQAQPGMVYCILAKSDQARTGDTGEVYAEELKRIADQRDDLVVLTSGDVRSIYRGTGSVTKTVQKIRERFNDPTKKYVIAFPLQIKELSYSYLGRWTKEGKKTEYFERLVDKHGGSHAEAVHDWIKNQGKLDLEDRTVEGPKPKDVARQYLEGITRVYQFARKLLPHNQLIIHGIGHQWDLDSVVTSFRSENVDYESFKETTGGTVIGESESMSITLGLTKRVTYRGRTFERQPCQ